MKKKDWLVRTSVAVLFAAMIGGATSVSVMASEEQEVVSEEESEEIEETEAEEESGEIEETEAEEESGEIEETEAEKTEKTETEEESEEEKESAEAEESDKVELEEPPVMYNGDGISPALVAADGYSILDVEEYLKNISLVSVDGEAYRVLDDAEHLILENGKLNTDAKPFEYGEFFEIQVTADGYSDLEFIYWVGGEWECYGDSDISIPLIDDVNHVCEEETDRKSKDPSIISREVYQIENEETVTWGYRILRRVRVNKENGR